MVGTISAGVQVETLNDALRLEENLSVAHRTPEQRQYLQDSLAQFWVASDRTFALAGQGKESEARSQIRDSLQARVAALSTAVARLLVANNENEQQAGERIERIYDGVQRQVYFFLVATLITILLTSVYLIRLNRLLFAQISDLSEQRSELAQKLIATQESTLLHISRELHDEFGQILTAVGSMLRRAGRIAVPQGSPLQQRFAGECRRWRSPPSTKCAACRRRCIRSPSKKPDSTAPSIGICPWWNGRTESSYTTTRWERRFRWRA